MDLAILGKVKEVSTPSAHVLLIDSVHACTQSTCMYRTRHVHSVYMGTHANWQLQGQKTPTRSIPIPIPNPS